VINIRTTGRRRRKNERARAVKRILISPFRQARNSNVPSAHKYYPRTDGRRRVTLSTHRIARKKRTKLGHAAAPTGTKRIVDGEHATTRGFRAISPSSDGTNRKRRVRANYRWCSTETIRLLIVRLLPPTG